MANKLIIATRKSKLALWQAERVKALLQQEQPHLNIELKKLTSEGDQNPNVPLNNIGGKDLFVKHIQEVVLKGEADLAVHSLKDMSAHDYENLTLGAFLERGDPRDAFISIKYAALAELPKAAIVGTASPRRQSLLKSLRPDLTIKLLRGNVETRLQKLDDGEYDAIILAAAGLERLGLQHRITEYLNPAQFIPAIGQGIIAVECKSADKKTKALLHTIDNKTARACATAERAFNQKLNGDCFTPLGAFATVENNLLTVIGFYGDLDGKQIIRAKQSGAVEQAYELGIKLAGEIMRRLS